MKKIVKRELLDKYGIDLPPGKYRIYTKEKSYEVYFVQDDTEGCILVGTARGAGMVLNSRVAFARLMEKIEAAYAREEEITMEVR